jgi:cell division protein FtsW (lipid II flippase)
MPIGFLLLTLVLLAGAVRVWAKSWWRTGRRVQFTVVVLAAIVVTLFFANWNLLGWRFG